NVCILVPSVHISQHQSCFCLFALASSQQSSRQTLARHPRNLVLTLSSTQTANQTSQTPTKTEQITTMTPKHGTPRDDSTISAFTDLIQKLTDNEQRSKAKTEELQEQMKKTDERLDIVVDELQTCTLLILRLKRTLAEFVEEHYE
ncbi:hypothetical protein D6C86_02043, partial [Aureobasidium pullulans]